MQIRLIALTTLVLALCGCEAYMFGMPASQFNQLSPSQKQQVIDSYNRREEMKAQNKPVEDLIGVLGTAVRDQNKRDNF